MAIRIGIIGTGGMANAHAAEFRRLGGVELSACCDIVPERAREFAERHRIPGVYTDYREMLEKEPLDAVSNVTVDAAHAEVALAVLARGLHILSEKPLASSLEGARAMAEAARQAGVVNMVNFSYRNSSGLQHAAEQVREGRLGRLRHVEASYLQGWLVSTAWGDWRTSPALTWRLSTRHGSLGVLGDLGCHIFDMTTLLCAEEIAELQCVLRTFDKGVPGGRIGEYELDANDSFIATVTFQHGALGTIHASRWAVGQPNSLRVRAYGDEGAIEVDLDRAFDEYRLCSGPKAINSDTWETVQCPPTPNNHERFIQAIRTGGQDPCDFANGVRVQSYLHACIVSDRERRPVAVE